MLLLSTRTSHFWVCYLYLNHDVFYNLGRTHLQDATPLTVGQQFTSYAHQLTLSLRRLCPLLACPEPVALPLKAGDGVNKDGDDDTVPAPAFSVPRYALMPDPINAGADLDNTAAYSANGGGQAQWPPLLALAQGGTAVGTGLNTAKVRTYSCIFSAKLLQLSGHAIRTCIIDQPVLIIVFVLLCDYTGL